MGKRETSVELLAKFTGLRPQHWQLVDLEENIRKVEFLPVKGIKLGILILIVNLKSFNANPSLLQIAFFVLVVFFLYC